MSKKLSSAIPVKKGDSKAKKPKNTVKTVIICCVSVILLLAVAWAVIGAVSAKIVLDPPRRELVYTDGPNEIDDMVYEFFEIKDFHGSDNIVGWWIPAQDYSGEYTESNKTVIMSHNYQSNREMTEFDGMFLIADLVHAGYNVITFDYTGSGNSKGSNYTFGVQEKDELLAVIDYMSEKYDLDKIALMGFAFGSAPAICAGCEDERVDVIIADSPYLDLKSYLDENLAVWSELPDFLFSSYIRTLMNAYAGEELDISPLSAVSSAENKKFLFLHGENDNIFPYQNTSTLAGAALEAGNIAEYFVFPGVGHCLGYIYAEDNYIATVLSFLSEHMK